MAEVQNSGKSGAPSAEEADRELRALIADPDYGIVARRTVVLVLAAARGGFVRG